MKKTIGFLGPTGTFSEAAALKYLAGAKVDLIPCPTFSAICAGVDSGQYDQGIIPLENSCEGAVTQSLDLLQQYERIKITAEVVLPVLQHLLAKPGTALTDIELVLSHPQALAQCRETLFRLLPRARVIEAASTAEAARTAAAHGSPYAAIGNTRAAASYGLAVLQPEINDTADNCTRFVVLDKTDCPWQAGQDYKTSLVVSIVDRQGALYQILGELARRGINLTKIESRPTKAKLGQYRFYIDLTGHRSAPPVQAALAAVAEQPATVQILGSYPAASV